MAVKKLYINPGHSNTDPGAIGYETERKLTVQVAKYMDKYIKENYLVTTKSNPGTLGDLNKITSEANSWGANLFVSIHFNASTNKSAHGGEVLVYNKNNKDLAQTFWRYINAVGQEPHGDPIKYRPDLAVLRLTNMKAILVECAFVTNKSDISDWNDPSELKTLGIALAKAAADYMNLPKKTKVPTYQTLQAMNMRSKPDLDSKVIQVIPKGIKLTGNVDSNGWLRTVYKNKEGYVRQKGKEIYCRKL